MGIDEGQRIREDNIKKQVEIIGRRERGTHLFLATELGYACPICGCVNPELFTFSEFCGFMWCGRCKLDIPSCFCKIYYEPKLSDEEMPKRLRVIVQTKIYLDSIHNVEEYGRRN